VRFTNAVGRRWTKAVAIRTPVPKCRERKRKRCGIGREGNLAARMGKEHAATEFVVSLLLCSCWVGLLEGGRTCGWLRSG